MTEKEVLSRFPAHRIEGALRFSAHEVRARDNSTGLCVAGSWRQNGPALCLSQEVQCGFDVRQRDLRGYRDSTESRTTVIRSLYARYKEKGFEFLLIYTKEPHPGENIPQPTTIEERVKNAARLKREEKVNFPILIDTPDNAG